MLSFLLQLPRMFAAAMRAADAIRGFGNAAGMKIKSKIKHTSYGRQIAVTAAVVTGVVLATMKTGSMGMSASAANGNNDNNKADFPIEKSVPADAQAKVSHKTYNAFADGAEVTVGDLMRTDRSSLSSEHRALAKIIDYVHSTPTGRGLVDKAAADNVGISFNRDIPYAAHYIPSEKKIELGVKMLADIAKNPATEGLAIYSLAEELGHHAHNKDSLMAHIYLNEGKEFKKFSYLPPEAAVHVNRHEEASAKVPAFMVLEELSHTPHGKKITDAVVAENPGCIYIARFYQDYSTVLNGRADIPSKIEAASVVYMHMMGDAQFIAGIDAGYISLPDKQLWKYPDSTDFKSPTGDKLAEWGKITIKGQEYNFLDNLAPGLNDPYYRNYPGRSVEFIERKSEALGLEPPEYRLSMDEGGRVRFIVNVADTASFERDTSVVSAAGPAGEITRPANDSGVVIPGIQAAKKSGSSVTPVPVYE